MRWVIPGMVTNFDKEACCKSEAIARGYRLQTGTNGKESRMGTNCEWQNIENRNKLQLAKIYKWGQIANNCKRVQIAHGKQLQTGTNCKLQKNCKQRKIANGDNLQMEINYKWGQFANGKEM